MRIVKHPDVRRKELLDAAERLFAIQGYTGTTINDIIADVGIAKGTFYHYFKSKEDILNAIIDRIIDQDVAAARMIADDETLQPAHKIYRILLAQQQTDNGSTNASKDAITDSLHEPEHAELHMKTMVRAIERLSPVLAEVVEQGVAAGVFHTEYPRETIHILLVSGQMLFDEKLFDRPPEQTASLLTAFIASIELLLGAEKGSFGFMLHILTRSL